MTTIKNLTRNRIVFIGIGGGSCTGKTTLARTLRSILPNSFVIHQDDFAPAEWDLPIHPVYEVPDWEYPDTAIEWAQFTDVLQAIKKGESIRGVNAEIDRRIGSNGGSQPLSWTVSSWRQIFERLGAHLAGEGTGITWGIVEGFLVYWHPEVVRLLDIRLFVRGDYKSMKSRRERRGDPPNYFDNLVWPAYLDAHRRQFIGGDVNGEAVKVSSDEAPVSNDSPTTVGFGHPIANLVVLPADTAALEEIVEVACNELRAFVVSLTTTGSAAISVD